ncbi:hypothetical protein ACOMHN_009094 [Nucella lapillus]
MRQCIGYFIAREDFGSRQAFLSVQQRMVGMVDTERSGVGPRTDPWGHLPSPGPKGRSLETPDVTWPQGQIPGDTCRHLTIKTDPWGTPAVA